MKAIRLPLLALALAALAFAGCGDDDDDEGGGQATSPPAAKSGTVKLSETDFKITPSSPQVEAGSVTFDVSNDGDTVHALEVEGPGGEQETDSIDPGGSAKLTVDLSEAGSYEMYCPIGNHRQLGMEGEISVGSGGESEDESGDDSGGGGGSSGY